MISIGAEILHVFLMTVSLVIALSLFISRAAGSLQTLRWWNLLCASLIVLIVCIAVALIWRQPQNTTKAAFMASHTTLVNGWFYGGKIQILNH